MKKTLDLKVKAELAEDGVWVIHVDTPGIKENARGPICRLYLNDGPALYANPRYRQKRAK